PRAQPSAGANEPPLWMGLLLVVPLAGLLGLLFVVPIVRVFWVALSDPHLGFGNFADFFHSPAAVRALGTTLRISATVTAIVLAVGVLVAWELRSTRSRLKRAVLWAAVLFPLWEGIIVRNYAFTILLEREGLLNKALQFVHVIQQPIGILYTESAVTIGIVY